MEVNVNPVYIVLAMSFLMFFGSAVVCGWCVKQIEKHVWGVVGTIFSGFFGLYSLVVIILSTIKVWEHLFPYGPRVAL